MLAYGVTMTDRFAKTETGRQEVRAPVHALSRSARTLLVIIDGTRPASEWLVMVQGATAQDLEDLVQAQLVEPLAAEPGPRTQGAPRAEPRSPAVEAPAAPAQEAAPVPVAEALGYQELYTALNALAREQLGLIKGYRFSLDIERASGLAELEAVAQRLVQEVQKAKGDAVARMVKRALRL